MFCNKPLEYNESEKLYTTCEACLSELPAANHNTNGCRSLFSYEGAVISIIHNFKYNGQRRLAYSAGLLMAEYCDFAAFSDVSALVPVPLHAKRLRERGYNQVDLVCKAISEIRNIPIVSGLKRTRETQALFGLSAVERKETVSGVFMYEQNPAEPCVKRKAVLLIDDIYTTGSTTNECAKVLYSHGVKNVYCMTFAKALISDNNEDDE
jgi:ComF family protein